MADAYGSGPYGRKSLRVQLPFRPFLFFTGRYMRKYNRYHSATVPLAARKRPLRRKKRSYFFFRFFLLAMLAGIIGTGVWLGLSKVYEAVSQAHIVKWQAKIVEVSGVEGPLLEQISAVVKPYQGTAFSSAQAGVLRTQLQTEFPMLAQVSVERGLLSGKLKVGVSPHTPVAALYMPDKAVKYLSRNQVIYEDTEALCVSGDLVRVDITGDAAEQAPDRFAEEVYGVIKLREKLLFSALQLDLTTDTLSMTLPDKSEINLGPVARVKEKISRAAEIIGQVKAQDGGPVRLDFTFFEYGQVFLTQKTH